MKATDDDLRDALGLDRRRRAAERASCPSAEEIATHAEGAGNTLDRARVLTHVAQCPHCAFEHRLASSLKPWAEGAAFALGPAPATRARGRATWWPAALAACLLLAVGLASWNLALRQRALDLRAELAQTQRREAAAAQRAAAAEQAAGRAPAPVTNVPIVDLEPASARGPSAAPAQLRLVPGAGWATFVLAVAGPAKSGEHNLELRADDGRVVWRGTGLVANRFGTFTVAVPQALLAPGRYELLLSRPASAGGARPIQAYRLVVAPQAP